MTTPKGFTGIGTVFSRWNGAAWVAVANINSIGGPSKSRETVDVTTLDSTDGYREFIGSLRDAGEITLNMNFAAATYTLMNDDFEDNDLQNYRIVLPDAGGSTFEFEGLVTDLPADIPLDDKVSADITIKISGKVTFTNTLTITEVETLAELTPALTTQLAEVGLPATVDATYVDENGDDQTESFDVVWDAGTPLYDGGSPGAYVFVGTLTMVDGFHNPSGLTASQTVTVQSS